MFEQYTILKEILVAEIVVISTEKKGNEYLNLMERAKIGAYTETQKDTCRGALQDIESDF